MGLSLLLIGKDTYSFTSSVQRTFVDDVEIICSCVDLFIFCN